MTIPTYLYFLMMMMMMMVVVVVVVVVTIMKTVTSSQLQDITATMKSRQPKKQKLTTIEIKCQHSIYGTRIIITEQ
jgi:uncharacterized membrane protein